MIWLLLLSPASALTLSLQSESQPYPGVTLREYRSSGPSADVFVALVDLCTDGVFMGATEPPDGNASTGSWGRAVGAQVASNGDFYTSGPQVYGDAVGERKRWPGANTGVDNQGEWYYRDYGWIAFLHDEVVYTHSKWVKNNLEPSTGWAPDTLAPDPPAGTVALVSGFPELVIDGEVVTCSSPTASDCFTDRSDMRDRHPRTAMGLSQDGQTFILAVVDGRTSSSSGMYGAELAELMGQLGAWVAFNLDGGGSSQLWGEDEGYLNNYSGNNSGGGARSVANHWGVFASGQGRPGHCATEPPCALLGPGGGEIDDDSACFQLSGDPAYWREASAGQGGHLYWTNAWRTDQPENQAWWRLELEEAGEYEVEVYLDPEWAVYANTLYEVVAAGQSHSVTVNQGAASGWTSLGSYTFEAGGSQWVSVFDHSSSSVSSDQHVVADALRLTRVDGWCGDGVCEEGCACPEDCAVEESENGQDDDCDGGVDEGLQGGGDSGPDSALDSALDSDIGGPGRRVRVSELGCASAPGGGPGGVLLALLALLHLRRRAR
ncbi:MAG: phosphodiester glycosidase family protein [Alphaproteobacteria bacterium]|nr:phosphodiester glycosidase family protein [Alphaproteobacteria bacterium]